MRLWEPQGASQQIFFQIRDVLKLKRFFLNFFQIEYDLMVLVTHRAIGLQGGPAGANGDRGPFESANDSPIRFGMIL
jgi:hypothetical protein